MLAALRHSSLRSRLNQTIPFLYFVKITPYICSICTETLRSTFRTSSDSCFFQTTLGKSYYSSIVHRKSSIGSILSRTLRSTSRTPSDSCFFQTTPGKSSYSCLVYGKSSLGSIFSRTLRSTSRTPSDSCFFQTTLGKSSYSCLVHRKSSLGSISSQTLRSTSRTPSDSCFSHRTLGKQPDSCIVYRKSSISSIFGRTIRSISRTPSDSCFFHTTLGKESDSCLLSRNPLHSMLKSPASFTFASPLRKHFSIERVVQDLLIEVERDRERERGERRKAGLDTADIDREDEEDYMGIQPFIDKLERQNLKYTRNLEFYCHPLDSDSDDDERLTPEAQRKRAALDQKKIGHHKKLLERLVQSETINDASKWMHKIDDFEKKHLHICPEYRVIEELLNRLKVAASAKEKFILQQKLNRGVRLLEWKEAFDPSDPANYGIIRHEQVGPSVEGLEQSELDEEKQIALRLGVDEDDWGFDDSKEDTVLLDKLGDIDKGLEEKLAALEYTFGRKGKSLEEEIRDLAEERNSLMESKRVPLYRKGFDVKLIDVNRTCKVTKGGQMVKYAVVLACGNYHGSIGFAKAKGPTVAVALQKAHEKCFQNLHFVDLYEDHTIAHAINITYKKTKLYLWPARTTTGMRGGKTVKTILNLAGFKNLKSKVIGSRNPYNTVKAIFNALNAIETPKDVQEKFGRTVVESYLL